jgi:hypothetical protein
LGSIDGYKLAWLCNLLIAMTTINTSIQDPQVTFYEGLSIILNLTVMDLDALMAGKAGVSCR